MKIRVIDRVILFVLASITLVTGICTVLGEFGIDIPALVKPYLNLELSATAGLLVRRAFAEEHPEAVAKFLEEYAASTDYANSHAAETAVLVEKLDIVKAAVAEKALPGCNLVCITGDAMKAAVSGYLQTLYDLKPEAVGGAMPTDGFYRTDK